MYIEFDSFNGDDNINVWVEGDYTEGYSPRCMATAECAPYDAEFDFGDLHCTYYNADADTFNEFSPLKAMRDEIEQQCIEQAESDERDDYDD